MEDRVPYDAGGSAKSPTLRDLRGWLDGLRPDQLDGPALVVVRSGVYQVSELAGGDPVVLVADVPGPVSSPLQVTELGELYALLISQRWALLSARHDGTAEEISACAAALWQTEETLIAFYRSAPFSGSREG